MVYYTQGPQHIYEFVHNSAEIDSQRVIFAHAINPQMNSALVAHFRDRSVWLVLVSDQNVELRPVLFRRTPGEFEVVPPPVVLPPPQELPETR